MENNTVTYIGSKLHKGQKAIVKDIITSDAMYYTVCCPRQWGKSYFLVQLMLYYAINNKDSKLMFTSPSYSQCTKIYNELLKGVENSGVVKKKNAQENSIILINGSEIYFKSVSVPDNLRGYSIDYMFCDEAAMYKDDTFNTVLRPMSTVRGKKTFLLSTPKGQNFFYKMYALGKNEEETRYRSYIGSSKDNPFANQEEIEDARKALPESIFRQEYLAEFISGGSVFPNLSINATINKWSDPVYNERYFAGIDLALQGDYLVLTIVNSKGEVVNCYRETKKPMSFMIERIKLMLNAYKPSLTLVETNGIGNGIYEYIQKTHNSVQPFNTSNKSKQDIIEDLIYDLNESKVKIPSKEFFPFYVDEMTDYGFTYSPKKRKVIYNSISGHDDCVMSLAIANHARRTGHSRGKYVIDGF